MTQDKNKRFSTLPETLEIEGVIYHLHCRDCSDNPEWKGWFCYIYSETEDELPPEVGDKHEWYFLCSMHPSKEEAYEDMLERINNMTKFKTK